MSWDQTIAPGMVQENRTARNDHPLLNEKHAPLANEKTAVLLVNLGTPEAPTSTGVNRFLTAFLSDPCVVDCPRYFRFILRLIIRFRAGRVAKLYQHIWMKEGSPLQVYTDRLAQRLQIALIKTLGNQVLVTAAMTYSNPNIANVFSQLLSDNIKRFIIIPLFPQYSKTTTKPIWNKLIEVLKQHPVIPSLHFIHEYANDDVYIQTLAQSILDFWSHSGRSERLLFSFHGIPLRTVASGDTYPIVCKKLAVRVAEILKIPENSYEISFQSRFGLAPWLTPYTDQTLRDFAQSGVSSVDVVSPSFAVDCLETLEELNITLRQLFLSLGGKKYQYIPALNASEGHIEVLKELILKFF